MVRTSRIGLLLSGLLLVGCGGEKNFQTGEVEGIVTRDGKPLAEVSVIFNPDNSKGTFGPSAGGLTDKDGRYRLSYTLPNKRDPASPITGDGALVGSHVIIVQDYKMMNELLPPPGRIPETYTSPGTTPLRFEVKSGSQTFNITITGGGR